MANKFEITAVKGREIIDCRGYPTLQIDVWVKNVVLGRVDVPCSRSTGTNQAFELREGENRYAAFGVRKVVGNVNQFAVSQSQCQK